MDDKQMKSAVARASKGDAEAFGCLYETLSREAFRFALYYLHDEADAADAVQNAALSAYRNIKNLKKHDSFRSWFFKIVANESKRIIAERKKESALFGEAEDIADCSECDFFLSAEIKQAMATLSAEDRMIVTLSVVDGFKSNEISEITGLKASSVRSRLSRALHSMREFLEPEGEK